MFGILSTSSRFGAVFSSLVLGSLLKWVGWRGVFLTAAAICAAIVTWSLFMLISSPKKIGLLSVRQLESLKKRQAEQVAKEIVAVSNKATQEEQTVLLSHPPLPTVDREDIINSSVNNNYAVEDQVAKVVTITHNHEKKDKGDHTHHQEVHFMETVGSLRALGYIFLSGRFWLVCISQMCFTIIFELSSFFPMYLKEVKRLQPSQAATSASVFGIGALSVLLFGIIYDRLYKVRFGRLVFMALLSLIATLCTIVLWLWQSLDIYLTMVVIFLLGVVSSPGFYLPMSVFSVQFGSKKHCAKISALIDFFGYSVAMVFDFAGGPIAEKYGWSSFFAIVVVAAVVSIVVGALFQLLDYYHTFAKKARDHQICC